MQKPIYSASDEQQLMVHLWSPQIADDLEAFVMFAFPWGKENTPLAKFKGPRKWQRKVLREITEHIKKNRSAEAMQAFRKAVSSGRGVGKSALVSWLILWMLGTRIGSTVIVSANSENQLRTVTWGELTKWCAMSINSHWWEPSATKLVPAAWLTDLVEKDLKKGTRYWAAEGKLWSEENPDAYAGVHNHDGMMVVLDEASGIPDAIWSVAAGFFTEHILDRYWFAFSNPRRNTGYFFECFNSKRDFWSTQKIDARTVEGTDKAVYQQIIDEHGEDSSQARVEVYGEFPAMGDDQFISPGLVDDAQKRVPYNEERAGIVLGVDPARGGNDSTVIVARRGRDVIGIKRYKGEDTMGVAGRVIEAIREFSPVVTVIDEGGLGYGVLDRLAEQRYKVRGVNFGSAAKNPASWMNKRAEMWGDMRAWLRTGCLPADRGLKTDLVSPRFFPNSSGAIQLESKKQMKTRGAASPDAADALAVTFAYPITETRILQSENFRIWPSSVRYPQVEYVLQSYKTAFAEGETGETSACTVWGVFSHQGERCAILLDAWDEVISYSDLRKRAIGDYTAEYGADSTRKAGMPVRGRRPDRVLVHHTGKGLLSDLRLARIPAVSYNPDKDEVMSAHQAAPTLDEGLLWIPESGKEPGQPISWSRGIFKQMAKFPDAENCDYVSTLVQAVVYLKNDGFFELQRVKDIDEPLTYNPEKVNPYAA